MKRLAGVWGGKLLHALIREDTVGYSCCCCCLFFALSERVEGERFG